MLVELNLWTTSCIVIGFVLISPSIWNIFRRNQFDVMGKTVFLIGASEGMGLSVAKQLAAKGANIIIAARDIGKLEKALEQVKEAATNSMQRFQSFSADISKPGEALKLINEACTWNKNQPPDVCWCIAGAARPGLFIDTPISIMRQMMETNYWSCVELAQGIISAWLNSGIDSKVRTHHLIFTSSVVAFFPIAGYTPYAPSKAAIRSLSDTLVNEILLYGDNIKIHTIFPGTILSPGFHKENITKPEITHILEAADPVQTPDVVAARAITGLEKGEYLVTVGWLGDAMRGCAWGGSMRNNMVVDTFITWITSLVWPFVKYDLDCKIKRYRSKV